MESSILALSAPDTASPTPYPFDRGRNASASARDDARASRGPSALALGALLGVLLGSLLLSGCKSDGGGGYYDENDNTAEGIIYQNAQRSLRTSNYNAAIAHLEQLEARFPFGRYAEQAQLELIYARYMSFELDSSQAAARRFIRLHPQHENVDYAYYMNGLAAQRRNAGVLDRLRTTDYSRRDVSGMREAFSVFSDMLKRFPNSEYAPDTRQRMIFLRDVLAASEVNIADYYMQRKAYVAASNRARYVIENYPSSAAVADALAIAIESNYQLGLEDAANDMLLVLAHNYPDYEAFDAAGNLVFKKTVSNRERSWLNVMSFGLLDRPAVPPPLEIQRADGGAATNVQTTQTSLREKQSTDQSGD
ncbi:MAG: outer membrane protein assembly factor BamD [Pseudomonadota bacterium]